MGKTKHTCFRILRALSRVYWLAFNTGLEAIRQKFLGVVLGITLALLISSYVMTSFDLSEQRLQFIAEFGFAIIHLFGTVLVVVLSVQLFLSEFEKGTVWILLAKPLRVWEYVGAKFCAIQFLMFGCLLFWCTSLAGLLHTYSSENPEHGGGLQYGLFFLYGGLQWLKFSMYSSIALFLASIARHALLAVMLALLAVIISQIRVLVLGPLRSDFGLLDWFLLRVSQLFPDGRLFRFQTDAIFDETALVGTDWPILFAYSCAYSVVYLALATWGFRQRQLQSMAQ